MGVKTRITFDLIKVYNRTLYWVKARPKPWALRIGKPSKALLRIYRQEGISSSAFITAYNPRSQKTSATENRKAQERLLKEIREKGYSFIPGVGKDPKGSWPGEPSFLVLDISLPRVVALGKKFRQNAIVFMGKNAVSRLVLLR